MHTLILDIEKNIYEGEVESLNLPGIDGRFEVLENHAPMIALLEEGIIKLCPKNANSSNSSFDFEKKNYIEFQIKKGTIEISQNKIVILI